MLIRANRGKTMPNKMQTFTRVSNNKCLKAILTRCPKVYMEKNQG
jgi:hypothetical protein